MKKNFIFSMCLIVTLPSFALTTSLQRKLNAMTLMTTRDITNNAQSNLNLTNNTGTALTVYGLYLYGIAFILPGQTCQNGIEDQGQNYVQGQYMAGGMATPIAFGAQQSIPIGQNYLYNMLYTYLYWRPIEGGATICSLPGCSWSTDTAQYNWCFQLGAISPEASYTYTYSQDAANIAPYAWPTANGGGLTYNYDLIPNTNDYVWLGPFTCNDQTLTCSTSSPQSQSFQQ